MNTQFIMGLGKGDQVVFEPTSPIFYTIPISVVLFISRLLPCPIQGNLECRCIGIIRAYLQVGCL
jgi:hypothetical protein